VSKVSRFLGGMAGSSILAAPDCAFA